MLLDLKDVLHEAHPQVRAKHAGDEELFRRALRERRMAAAAGDAAAAAARGWGGLTPADAAAGVCGLPQRRAEREERARLAGAAALRALQGSQHFLNANPMLLRREEP